MEYASKGIAGTGLGLGIAGTALGLMGGNGLGLLNLGGGCSENVPVNRYELGMQKELTNKDMEIAYLRSREAAKEDTLETYKYIDGQLREIRGELREQAVYNGVNTATVGCLQGQVQQLLSLTKLIVPNANICPGWGDVTITTATSGT